MPAAGVDSPAHAIQRVGSTFQFGLLCVSWTVYPNGKRATATACAPEVWKRGNIRPVRLHGYR
jgi:hypothetical protein